MKKNSKREELEKLIKEELESMDEDIRNEVHDVYYSPNSRYIYFVPSGMAYEGYDKEAYEVAQVEDQEVINWHV